MRFSRIPLHTTCQECRNLYFVSVRELILLFSVSYFTSILVGIVSISCFLKNCLHYFMQGKCVITRSIIARKTITVFTFSVRILSAVCLNL
jgi:hypothetical protein